MTRNPLTNEGSSLLSSYYIFDLKKRCITHFTLVFPTYIAELQDQQTWPSCGTNGHCQVAGLTDIAKLQDQQTLPSCGTDGHCQAAGPMDIAKSRDPQTLPSRGTNGLHRVAGPMDIAKLRN